MVARVVDETRMEEMQSFQFPPDAGEHGPETNDRFDCELVNVIELPA